MQPCAVADILTHEEIEEHLQCSTYDVSHLDSRIKTQLASTPFAIVHVTAQLSMHHTAAMQFGPCARKQFAGQTGSIMEHMCQKAWQRLAKLLAVIQPN